jgi:hypothetical protein
MGARSSKFIGLSLYRIIAIWIRSVGFDLNSAAMVNPNRLEGQIFEKSLMAKICTFSKDPINFPLKFSDISEAVEGPHSRASGAGLAMAVIV